LVLEPLEDRCLLSADVVLEWNAVALDALKYDSTLGANSKQNDPDRASRALAITQAAVFDAVNSIDGSYDPYLVEVPAPRGASITAAAAQAAHDTLAVLFPDYRPVLDARLAEDLADVHSARAREDGVQVGQTVAAAILAARSHDGSDVPMHYTPGDQPGQWRPDPLHQTQKAVGPLWGDVTPFALQSAEQFHVPAPPAITSEAYADAYQEVKNYGGDGVTTPTLRTAEQTEIAFFWGYDGSPGLATPPRMSNQIAETLAAQQHNSVAENARFFALIDIALADAAITCWDGKYDFSYWRPVTAIRENDPGTGPTGKGSGNPFLVGQGDPNWRPLGAPADNGSGSNFTPPFPSYASGHATFGGALFRMMADFYGRDDVHFTIGSDEFNGVTRDQNGVVRPVVTRSFDSFSDAAEENGQSRIYLGIHWSFDKVQGIASGSHIADYVFANYLRPRHDHDHDRDQDDQGPQGGDVLQALAAPGAVAPAAAPTQTPGRVPDGAAVSPAATAVTVAPMGAAAGVHNLSAIVEETTGPLLIPANGPQTTPSVGQVPLASEVSATPGGYGAFSASLTHIPAASRTSTPGTGEEILSQAAADSPTPAALEDVFVAGPGDRLQ
jgi:hypothetical protein